MTDTPLDRVPEQWRSALVIVAHPDDLASMARPVGARLGVTYAGAFEVIAL